MLGGDRGAEIGDCGQPEDSSYLKHERNKDQEIGKRGRS